MRNGGDSGAQRIVERFFRVEAMEGAENDGSHERIARAGGVHHLRNRAELAAERPAAAIHVEAAVLAEADEQP